MKKPVWLHQMSTTSQFTLVSGTLFLKWLAEARKYKVEFFPKIEILKPFIAECKKQKGDNLEFTTPSVEATILRTMMETGKNIKFTILKVRQTPHLMAFLYSQKFQGSDDFWSIKSII